MRLAHLNRVQNPIVNRLRQDLAWQFPEVAKQNLQKYSKYHNGLVQWLAEIKLSARYDNQYRKSIGLGLQSSVRHHAARLYSIHSEEFEIEAAIADLISADCYRDYLTVFEQFRFGDRVAATILSQIYPIEAFLDSDCRPIVRQIPSRINPDHRNKKYISRARFTKCLGVAPSESSSGDYKSVRVTGGSSLCRIALWQWCFTKMEVKRNRPNTEIGKLLADLFDRN